jgi:hypothetical protein
MWSSRFWDRTSYGPVESTYVSEEHTVSTFRVEEQAKQETRSKRKQTCSAYSCTLQIEAMCSSDTSIRFRRDYTALHSRKYVITVTAAWTSNPTCVYVYICIRFLYLLEKMCFFLSFSLLICLFLPPPTPRAHTPRIYMHIRVCVYTGWCKSYLVFKS